VERNRKAGQNPPRVVAPVEEEEEEEEEELCRFKIRVSECRGMTLPFFMVKVFKTLILKKCAFCRFTLLNNPSALSLI
jgi:hypothetical protein